MGAFTSYLLFFTSLFFTDVPTLPNYQEDSMNLGEILLADTLHLPLAGPGFEVSFYKDGILLLSPMHEGIGWVPMDPPDISLRKSLFASDPRPYPPAGSVFTSDQEVFYSSWPMEIPGFFSLEKIFRMAVDSGVVSGTRPLAFTLDSCRYLDPALSRDDSLMIFSSDRLPTRGGLDLFATRRDSSGWSVPVPLDSSINSSGHERYPFLDQMNNLWFSTTGQSSQGDYELCVCPFNGLDWEPPRILGSGINTSQDETGFSIHRSGQVALFTRKSRSGGRAVRVRKNQTAMERMQMAASTDWNISDILLELSHPLNNQAAEQKIASVSEPLLQEDTLVKKPVSNLRDQGDDPRKVIFRVQILSSTSANTTPTVVIEGNSYETHEYFYKGAYRITVGQFESVQAANTFRLQCRRAGFNQAFVAAFRGGTRETDPSVFKE